MDKTTTTTWLFEQYDGADGATWLRLSVEADKVGRSDLVTYCRDQAEQAYIAEDEQ